MLSHLSIRDYLLVEQVELDFAPGLTVLTGETGAGKSILIDALALALGERTEANVVRGTAARAEISAEFLIDAYPEVHAWLDESGLACEDTTLILRRTIDANGRSRGFINGTPVTLAQLKVVAEFLVDIHGQHAYHALLRRPMQRQILDGFGGTEALAVEVGAAWRAWQDALHARDHAETYGHERQHQREMLAAAVEALMQLGDDLPRWEELQAEHARLAHVTHLIEGSLTLINGLDDDDTSVRVQLNAMGVRLSQMAEFDPGLGELVQLLNAASANIAEAVHGLRRYADKLNPDPARLLTLDRRMSEMHQLARKHHTQPHALHTLCDALQQQLQVLHLQDDLEALRHAERSAWSAYEKLTATLSSRRRKAALELSANVTAAIQELALTGGIFQIMFEPVPEPRAHGMEEIEFQVAAHAGLPGGALAKVASGGELSRIGLAIQTALSGVAGVPTLIFDEVDVGIGGAVAESVGRRLAKLGLKRQVLVITHLPQVAARGMQHLRVTKSGRGGKVASQIEVLDASARVEEIARMLGGYTITATTRQHAAEMLAG